MILIASLVVFQIFFKVNGIPTIPPPKALITEHNEVQAYHRIKRDNQLMSNTSVISHEFPLTDDNLLSKPKKEELHTFAELQFDPKASFPPSFTICSTIMTTVALKGRGSIFFSLLGNAGDNYLYVYLDGNMESFVLFSGRFSFKAREKINRVFPEQWLSTCLAVNTESGLLQWVVDTQLVANVTIEAIRQNSGSRRMGT